MVSPQHAVVRVQTGVRLEQRLLKVLKALAEYKNLSLGDLLEGIVLHAFDGKTPFTPQTLQKIADLKRIYELTECGEAASTNDLARELNIKPASVTGMIQKLAAEKPALVET